MYKRARQGVRCVMYKRARQGVLGGRVCSAAGALRKQTTGSEKTEWFCGGTARIRGGYGRFFTTCYNFVTKSAKELYNLALY